MTEFGSDFHLVEGFEGRMVYFNDKSPVYTSDGRIAIAWSVKTHKFARVWVPQYFCYEVLDYLTKVGINWITYPDWPEADDESIIANINFGPNDVLLRMNYFGLRQPRDNSTLNVTVIEDHTHGLLSNWARKSNADFCIASIRKTVPIAEGGVAWSPLKKDIEPLNSEAVENSRLVEMRNRAMLLKREYLRGKGVNKDEFRKLFVESEELFDNLPICSISDTCFESFAKFDLEKFERRKKENWQLLTSLLCSQAVYLKPEGADDTPFSLVLKFESETDREVVRRYLIEHQVYPAVLWAIPEQYRLATPYYLSVHCDGRYSSNDIKILANIINDAFKNR